LDKGVDLWLLAAREAVDRLGADRIRFVWVGYRDNRDGLQFRSMISRLGLDSQVELVAETERPYDQFARFDMFAYDILEESASWLSGSNGHGYFPSCALRQLAVRLRSGWSRRGDPVDVPTRNGRRDCGSRGITSEAVGHGKRGAERVRENFSREESLDKLTRVFDAV